MSLDTVELVVDIENHFDIRIPDPEAENISTVQQLVDCVFAKVILNPSQKCNSQVLFYRIRTFFINDRNVVRKDFLPDKKLKDLIPVDELKTTWENLAKSMGVELPSLSLLDTDPDKGKDFGILGLKIMEQKKPLREGTIEDLINWILACNHEKFIDPKCLCNKHDIERIIIGIISERVGMDVDEIKLPHSITNDLGID